VARGRRQVSQATSIHDDEVKTPSGIAAALRDVMSRLSDLESDAPEQTAEFERDVSAGGATVKLYHGFGKPVRYWVTYWTRVPGGAYPTTAPILVAQADSTDNELSLKSYVAGRAIIRVEANPAGIEL
jgi:hypothetical protein